MAQDQAAEAPADYPRQYQGKLYLWQYDEEGHCRRIHTSGQKQVVEEFDKQITDIQTDENGNDWVLTTEGLFLNGFEEELPQSDSVRCMAVFHAIALTATNEGIVIYSTTRHIMRSTPYPDNLRKALSECHTARMEGKLLVLSTPTRQYTYHIINGAFSLLNGENSPKEATVQTETDADSINGDEGNPGVAFPNGKDSAPTSHGNFRFSSLIFGATGALLVCLLAALLIIKRRKQKEETTLTTDAETMQTKEETAGTAGEGTKTEATETESTVDDGSSLSSRDARFLARLEEAVANYIEDPTLNVDTLAALMQLGRSHLYNRIKLVTDMAPSDYLRKQRLKHAATLLEDPELSIKEIHTRCGFNNSTKFYSHFKQEFGLTPGEYRMMKLKEE